MTVERAIRELGIPVRSVSHVELFCAEHADGSPAIYATMAQVGAPFFVIDIDLQTGHCTKYLADLPRAMEAVSAMWSARRKCLFAGSCYTGHLHRFDPQVGRVEDLGAIHAADKGAANFPCSMDEHPDGSLYIGSYGKCDLTRYDPDRGVFTNYGRMDPVDMYLYVQCGVDGTIAALVRMTQPHVVAFDPRTGQHRTVGPVADRQTGEGSVQLIKGCDGLLYIQSHAGAFRVQGLEAVPVSATPSARPTPSLPDGRTVRFLDADVFECRRLEITEPDGQKREVRLDWEGDGTDLFLCHRGPDGKVYGSSMLPEHLFRYDPQTGEIVDFGACSVSGGEAYSMGNLDGKLYIASYPAARLSIYDPTRPYRFGTDPAANPRDIGRIDAVSYRPRAMVAGPAGKVWIASLPDYGMWGGTLAWYDPRTGRFGSHRNVIPDCSGQSMTYLEEEKLLLVGFATEGGTGTQPRAERAGMVLWDPCRDALVWQGDMGLDINAVYDLCAVGEGRAYALILPNGKEARPGLYLLDLRERHIIAGQTLNDPPHGWTMWGNQCLFAHRGFIYGATYRGIFRARIGAAEVEMYCATPEFQTASGTGVVVGDTWIFPRGHQLKAMELPRA